MDASRASHSWTCSSAPDLKNIKLNMDTATDFAACPEKNPLPK